jgi:hypothetical protein
MDLDSVVHGAIDLFAVIAAILGIIALFIDPKEGRVKFLRISLVVALVVLSGFIYWQYTLTKTQARTSELEIKEKAELILKTLCDEGDLNFEELYVETSHGGEVTVMDSALDLLTQVQHQVSDPWPSIPVPGIKRKSLPIRMYHVDPMYCPISVQDNPKPPSNPQRKP